MNLTEVNFMADYMEIYGIPKVMAEVILNKAMNDRIMHALVIKWFDLTDDELRDMLYKKMVEYALSDTDGTIN